MHVRTLANFCGLSCVLVSQVQSIPPNQKSVSANQNGRFFPFLIFKMERSNDSADNDANKNNDSNNNICMIEINAFFETHGLPELESILVPERIFPNFRA